MLKSVTSRKLTGAKRNSGQMLDKQGSLKEKVFFEEEKGVGESDSYRQSLVEMIKRKVDVHSRENNMLIWTAEKERVFHG